VQAFGRAGVQETEEDVETKKTGEALPRHSRQTKEQRNTTLKVHTTANPDQPYIEKKAIAIVCH
jgi:hypothetical protein